MSGRDIDRLVLEGKIVDPPSGFIVPDILREWASQGAWDWILFHDSPLFVPAGDPAFKAETSQPGSAEGWAHFQTGMNLSLCPEHFKRLSRDVRRDRWRERLLGPARYWLWLQRCRLGNLLVGVGEKLLGDDSE